MTQVLLTPCTLQARARALQPATPPYTPPYSHLVCLRHIEKTVRGGWAVGWLGGKSRKQKREVADLQADLVANPVPEGGRERKARVCWICEALAFETHGSCFGDRT